MNMSHGRCPRIQKICIKISGAAKKVGTGDAENQVINFIWPKHNTINIVNLKAQADIPYTLILATPRLQSNISYSRNRDLKNWLRTLVPM